MTNHTLHTRLQTSSLPISLSLSSPQGWECNCTSFLQSLEGKVCVCVFCSFFIFLPSNTAQHCEVQSEEEPKGHKMQTGGPQNAHNVKLNFLQRSMK